LSRDGKMLVLSPNVEISNSSKSGHYITLHKIVFKVPKITKDR